MADGWFSIGAIVLVWIAGALGAFALLGDALVQWVKRWRGTARKHCPKCWYDLSQTAAGDAGHVTCSECSYVVTRERRFYRGRRRWGLVAIALLLLLGSYAVHVTPAVRERGMVAAMPTTVLILYLPWYDTEQSEAVLNQPISLPPANDLPLLDQLYNDLRVARLGEKGALGRFNERLLVQRCIKGDADRLPLSQSWRNHYGAALSALASSADLNQPWWHAALGLIEIQYNTREVWPTDAPIWVELEVERWEANGTHVLEASPISAGINAFSYTEFSHLIRVNYGNHWRHEQTLLGIPANGDAIAYDVKVAYGGPSMYSIDEEIEATTLLRWEPAIEVAGTISDYLEPVDDVSVGAAIAELFTPSAVITHGRTNGAIALNDRLVLRSNVLERIGELTLGFDVQLLRNGETVGTSEVWYRISKRTRRDGSVSWRARPMGVRIDATLDEHLVALEPEVIEEGEWTLRLIGSPEVALRDFEATHYWAGDVELPIKVTARRPWAPAGGDE